MPFAKAFWRNGVIAADTNIVIRFLVNDDEAQHLLSRELFQTQSVFLSDTVILETEWVLRFSYKFNPNDIFQAFNRLLGLPNVQVVDANRIAQALQWHLHGLGFADAFHLACSQHCPVLYTFDRQFARRAQALTDLEVLDLSKSST